MVKKNPQKQTREGGNPQNKQNCVLSNQTAALTQKEDKVLRQHREEMRSRGAVLSLC